MLAVGCLVTRSAILPVASRRAVGGDLHGDTMERKVAGLALVVGVAVLGGLTGLFWRQADELRFPGDPLAGAAEMLLGTAWATSWWWGVGGAGAFLLGSILVRRGRSIGWALAWLGVLPLVALPGLTGHANSADARLLALGVDAIHVAAAGAWIGSLGVILLIGRQALRPMIEAFSPVAIASVTLLVMSGATASLRMIDPIAALWTTDYGRTLSLKVGLFLVVALLGLWNWKRRKRRLGSFEGDAAMVRSATTEFLIAQIVLVVTAVLVRTSP